MTFPDRELVLRVLVADQAHADWRGPGLAAYEKFLDQQRRVLVEQIEVDGTKAARRSIARWDALDDLERFGDEKFVPEAWDYWVYLDFDPDASAAAVIACQWRVKGVKKPYSESIADVNLGDGDDTEVVGERLEILRAEVAERLVDDESPQARARAQLTDEIQALAASYNAERDQRLEHAGLSAWTGRNGNADSR